ncbi:MATE family efflux transporter [Halomonas halocynthiae]|uniref:MATE family efflux transporter n=1 Tax=Halomonas halocynthiae TaxID=176290 RepID=UPI00040E49F6|nr:MATE family efflux transporter [Halomonas halocynthiae]
MTEPSTSYRRLWTLAWPIILSNITVPLLGLVDTAVVGHLPDAHYLAAVTLGATLFSFLFWGFGFLRMGTTGLTSQAAGRDDDEAVRNLLGQSLLLAIALGAGLIIAGSPLISLGLWLLDGSEQASLLAAEYASIRLLSAPAVLANYAILGWFLGQQNSRVTLAIMLLTNGVNIVFDLLFVIGLGMTSNGVAWATVIADYSGLALGLWLISRQLKRLEGRFLRHHLLRLAAYAELFNVNANLFVRTLGLLFAMAFFTAQGAAQGDIVLAANAVLLQFIMLTSYGLDGFAHATESLIGRAIGKQNPHIFNSTLRAATLLSVITAGLATLAFLIGGQELIALLTGLDAVRDTAAIYLPWMIALPLIAVWSYLLDGVFIGATAIKQMRNSVFIGLTVFLTLWWAFQWLFRQQLLADGLLNHALWLSFMVFFIVRSGVLVAYLMPLRRRYGDTGEATGTP